MSGMQEALPEKMRKAHPPPAALPTNLGKSSCQGAPGGPVPSHNGNIAHVGLSTPLIS